MPVFVCMLRGVNLGGHNMIKMETLRSLCGSLRLTDAQTYVQSGNVVFRAKPKDVKALGSCIEDTIESELGFRPSAILRTTEEMSGVVARNPFAKRKNIEPGKLIVAFFATEPTNEASVRLKATDIAPNEVHIVGRQAYIYFPDGQGRATLKWNTVDKILGLPNTGRNWNTTTKLLEMAESLERKL
jgi:uncharacterized protein (DUF1697 family)